jgi:hypothetical protein
MIQGITSDKFENVIIPVGSARSPYSPYSGEFIIHGGTKTP